MLVTTWFTTTFRYHTEDGYHVGIRYSDMQED